ncbi:unnamed protein product [Brassica oleracea]
MFLIGFSLWFVSVKPLRSILLFLALLFLFLFMFYDLFRFYTVFYGGDSLPHFIFYGFSFLIKIISLFLFGL